MRECVNALDGCGQHRVVVRNARAQAKGNPQIAGADEQAVDLGYRGNAFKRLQAGPGFDHRQRQRQHLRVGVLGLVGTPHQQSARRAEGSVAFRAAHRVAAGTAEGACFLCRIGEGADDAVGPRVERAVDLGRLFWLTRNSGTAAVCDRACSMASICAWPAMPCWQSITTASKPLLPTSSAV